MQRLLVLVRHGQSEGNAGGVFTGWNNPGLTSRGFDEAEAVARALKGTQFDIVFTSALKRAEETVRVILRCLNQDELPVVTSADLNERHYGQLTGVTKQEACRLWGEDHVKAWQRSYSAAPPGGESLHDTLARVLPYYLTRILPHILRGEKTLLVAHGNSLRALTMSLERISSERITALEIPTGSAFSYRLNTDGTIKYRTSL